MGGECPGGRGGGGSGGRGSPDTISSCSRLLCCKAYIYSGT